MDTGIPSESLALPRDLLSAIAEEAEAEQRSSLEVMQDAFNQYMREKRWQRTLESGQARARTMGFSEEDVPRLIAESREEQRERP